MRASGVAGTTQKGPSLEKRLGNLAIGAANLFPLWLVIGATSALAHPPSLAWFKREYITKGLALTMLSMGTTLTLEASYPCCLTQLSLRSCTALYGLAPFHDEVSLGQDSGMTYTSACHQEHQLLPAHVKGSCQCTACDS